MAALLLSCPSSLSYPCSSTMASSFSLIIFITFSFLSFSLLLFSLFKRPRKGKTEELEQDPQTQNSISALKLCLSKISDKTKNTHLLNSSQLPHSVILELLSSNSPKWGALFSPTRVCDDPIEFGLGSNSGGEDNEEERNGKKKKRKRKKRVKKKKENSSSNSEDLQLEIMEMENGGVERDGDKKELVCLYPFTSSCSVTQRKIKQQYDQLVKSHESKGLTLAQVGQFVNCLVDAKNELQHKSECVKRKFTITKALLLKADRSSFDRLRQQICKLELEQKRLEEDAFVYNWLQHQLKLSPAYKKMVEIGSCMELKAKSGELTENLDRDDDQDSISFEEFLAQEKKDAFWQKHGKLKTGGSHPT